MQNYGQPGIPSPEVAARINAAREVAERLSGIAIDLATRLQDRAIPTDVSVWGTQGYQEPVYSRRLFIRTLVSEGRYVRENFLGKGWKLHRYEADDTSDYVPGDPPRNGGVNNRNKVHGGSALLENGNVIWFYGRESDVTWR